MEEKIKNKGSLSRNKGHSAERYYAKIFQDLGFTFCKTSRASSRMMDDAGIDLNFLPFNVQIKAGYPKGLNEFKTLEIIEERLPLLFPPYDPVHKKANILIHKKNVGRGKKSTAFDELVFLWTKDYKKLFNKQLDLVIPVVSNKKMSFESIIGLEEYVVYTNKDGLSLVVMTFQKFTELIKNKKWE